MSQKVDGGKPTDLGEVMSKKVDAIGLLEVGKGKYPKLCKVEVRKELRNQKIYCEPQIVGLCVSQEVDGGKPTDLGDVMSKKVDAIGPLEVGKGKYSEVHKIMPQEKGKTYLLKRDRTKNFRKPVGVNII